MSGRTRAQVVEEEADPSQESRPPRAGRLIIKRSLSIPRRAIEKGGPVDQLAERSRRGSGAFDLWPLLIAAADPKLARLTEKYGTLAHALSGDVADLTSDAARARVARGLATLSELQLVRLEPRGRDRTVQLLALDGSGGPYVVPRGGAMPFIKLPSGYFEHRWHRVLSVPAKAFLLIALAEEGRQWNRFDGAGGRFTAGSEELAERYGLARSSIEKAKAELGGLGFLRYNPEPAALVRGRRLPRTLFVVQTGVLAMPPDEAPRTVKVWSTTSLEHPVTGKRLSRRDYIWMELTAPGRRSADGAESKPARGERRRRGRAGGEQRTGG
jgi:hypothetical protein